MNIKTIIANKVVKNAGWIIGGKLFYMVFAFIVGLLTARYLGPGNFGIINYATAYTTFFASICTLGINSVIVKEFIDHPEEQGCAIGTTLVLRAISSILSAFMITGISCLVDRGDKITILVVSLCSIGVIFQVFDTINYWFQAKLMSKYPVVISTIGYIVMSSYKVVLLITKMDVRWFALATSVEYIMIAVLLLLAYKIQHGPKFSFSITKAKTLLQSSCHFILAGLMVAIYGSTDKLMLKHMLDEKSVGYYSTAVSLCMIWTFVLTAIIDSLYPSIMSYFKDQDIENFNKTNRLLYSMVFYISGIVSVLYVLLSKYIIMILYGDAYLPAAKPLMVITWYVAFSYLGVARNAWIVSYNRQKYIVFLSIGAAFTNIVLNALLIPHFGEVGAAIASLVTQTSTILIFPFLIKDLRPNAILMLEAISLKDLRKKIFNR